MTDSNDAQSLDVLDRAITPVAGATTARPGSSRKVVGTVALIALCGGLLWASWKRAPTEAEARTNPTISVGSSFERLRDPPSEPAQTAALPVTVLPPAQPQRVERSQADDLLESSRRAPVLVYNRPPQARPGSASTGYPNDPAGALPSGRRACRIATSSSHRAPRSPACSRPRCRRMWPASSPASSIAMS
jgi:type IV secretion system protein VirB10